MKRLLVLCLSVVLLSNLGVLAYNFTPPKQGMTRFLGTVVYPHGVKNLSEIKVLYKGQEYSVDAVNELSGVPCRGHFQLIEKPECKEMFVLVSESLKRPYDTGFEYFETSAKHPYKLFKLSRVSVAQSAEGGEAQKSISWDVQELDNSEQRQIPINTIVLLLPASFVTGLEVEPWQEDEQVVWLPKFIMDEHLVESELREGIVKMLCTLMDFKPFHSRAEQHIIKVASNCLVSMPLMNSRTAS